MLITNMQKVYLGDGVYAELQWERLVLTTNNGISITNTITLEPEIVNRLLAYLKGQI